MPTESVSATLPTDLTRDPKLASESPAAQVPLEIRLLQAGGSASAARLTAKAALGTAALLAVWLLATWLAGADHVETVSVATVDGGAVARVLALSLWTFLALAVLAGILAERHRSATNAGQSFEHRNGEVVLRPASWLQGQRAAIAWVTGGAVFVVGVYHGLLGSGAITWGDWGYFVNASAVRSLFPVPSLWSFTTLGSYNVLGASVAPIESAMGAMAHLGVPYSALERLWFYYPCVVLSFCGPIALARRLGTSWPLAAAAAAFYTANPYALALISGGELTVGMGYALYPWIALGALRLWSRRTAGAGFALGGLLGLQAWYDPRTAGLSVAGLLVASVVLMASMPQRVSRVVPWTAVLAGSLVFALLQGPWLVPALVTGGAHLPGGYTTTAALTTFSLLSLLDGLTVFHPFWPTMRFIALHSVPVLWMIVPIMVALALIRQPSERRVHVGTVLYLVFAALVSGANEPFGALNAWLFAHVPGMDLFRDPSPYLGPIALGVVLVLTAPVGTDKKPLQPKHANVTARNHLPTAWARWWRDMAARHLAGRSGVQTILSASCLVLVLVSAWPAISGALRHNLAPRRVPAVYNRLDRLILTGPPGAVLWVPSTSRFALVSPEHPSISAFGLESTNGVNFPTVVRGLEWLGVPSAVNAVAQRYGIGTVVVNGNLGAYRDLSLPPLPTRTEALASFGSLPGSTKVVLPGLTVFQLRGAPPYPVAAFNKITGPPALATRPQTTPPSLHSAVGRHQILFDTFGHGLLGWGPVANGNNYLHLKTLGEAGISASAVERHQQGWVRLTVRYGAASIAQNLRSCPQPGVEELHLRYRTSQSGSLAVLLFSASQPPPVAAVSFSSTAGRWVEESSEFVLAPTLVNIERRVQLRKCALVLSAQPMVAGTASYVDVASLSVSAHLETPLSVQAAPSRPLGRWQSTAPPRTINMTPTGDRTLIELPPSDTTRLLVFWQRYDPGWVARPRLGRTLRHVEVNGWANGFLVPSLRHHLYINIEYKPQDMQADGFIILLGGLFILALAAVWWVGRRASEIKRAGDAKAIRATPGQHFALAGSRCGARHEQVVSRPYQSPHR